MKYLLLAFSFLYFQNTYAQSCLWAKAAGSSLEDYGASNTVDANGNLYVAGNFASTSIIFGATTLVNANSSGSFSDVFLVKYRADGSVAWVNSGGGLDSDYPTSVCTDNYGNVYVTGYFHSDTITFGALKLVKAGGTDLFIAKYDTSGNLIWVKNTGGTAGSTVLPECITTDLTGNILVAGTFNSPVLTFGSYTLNNAGINNDMFLVKYDSSGAVTWALKEGSIGHEEGLAVKADAVGNIYVTGNFTSSSVSFGSTTLSLVGIQNMFVVKYNAIGNVLWAKGAGGASVDVAYSLALDPSANIYITGMFESPIMYFGTTSVTNTFGGSKYFFLARYDSSGNIAWAKSAGGNDENAGICAAADSSGNIFVTGYFTSATLKFDTITLTNALAYTRDVFLVNYDTAGNVIWAKRAGGNANDGAISVVTKDSSVYITGYFTSSAITFDTSVLANHGYVDFYLAKYREHAHVAPVLAASSIDVYRTISVFPNPASMEITVQGEHIYDIHDVQVFDVAGNLKYTCSVACSKPNHTNTVSVHLPDLPEGVYILYVTGNCLSESIPFAIRH